MKSFLVNGGEVAVGVPEYRMPISKYQKDIDLVLGMEAVSITNNCRVDAEKLRELDRDYDAVFLGLEQDYLKRSELKMRTQIWVDIGELSQCLIR